MSREGTVSEERVLVVAPRGRDKILLGAALEKAKLDVAALGGVEDLPRELERGAGALLLEEEAFDVGADQLIESLKAQPAWSNVPVIVLTAQSRLESQTQHMVRALGQDLNVVLLERPIRTLTLLQTVRSALASRKRQYEVRDFQKTLERRVVERTRHLKAALEEMDAFTYTIAHDLRAPLRALHRFGEILESDYGTARALEKEGIEYVRQIRAGATRMDSLIQDLLHYSRMARTDVTLSTVVFEPLIASILRGMEPEIRERKAQVTVEASGSAALADPMLLSQALTNLISNAIKFVPRGRNPVVRIRAEAGAEWTRIWVEDNGIGIDPRHQGKIFKVFERLGGSDFPGTGIGLAIVRRVVERQGGRSGVASEKGRGSRFWIDLRNP